MTQPQTFLSLMVSCLAMMATAGCEGVMQVGEGDESTLVITTPGSESESTTPPGYVGPGGPQPSNPGTTVPDPQTPPPLLHNATFGERCVDGAVTRYLILSDDPSDCATDAARIDAAATSGSVTGAVVVPLDGTNGPRTVTYCVQEGDCRQVVLDLNVVDQVTSLTGTWSGAPDGQQRSISFTAQSCAYDSVVTPLPSDSPATGISVTEVAVYQGVKIPIFEGGSPVNNLNAPIIAGRPGVMRVFVRTEADWQQRELVARLTVGDLVKEESFTPTGSSTEMVGDSTANFTFEADELPAGVEYSVELLEAQSCSAPAGAVANPRVPATGTTALQSEALASTMRITLVPIEYNADGTGRVPRTDQATIDRWRDAAFSQYPIPGLEITVREPYATNQGLSPGGGGFGQMLNLCLNIRAQDNPPDDVYYYCVIQPADSVQQFCGGGCVAGIAPVPGPNDVDARGGIGVGFDGGGEDTFVHEVGHALGRRHSPCGGAAGADGNYPYSQGRIGSWGYDIITGNLYEPSGRADFMGYCNPTWVSDYTYEKIHDRLERVIGAQTVRTAIAPTRFKTAVVEGDGTVSWGDDIMRTHRPTGLSTPATLRTPGGETMGTPEVWVTEIADIDAVLVRVADPGISGTIDVPGVGELALP